ncbi:MAG: hypothetical protein SGJ18_01885 [Pseudomonadota bacterium]|nr:hypothetical protein [Pseudomonadota bacterium]
MLFFKTTIIIFVYTVAATAKASERTERYRKLLAQEQRVEALDDIAREFSLGPWPQETIKEFKSGQREIGETFISERAQHLYEVGVSLTYKGDNSAVRSLIGASQVESENLKILLSLARSYLSQSDCAGASESINKITKNFFLLEEKYILAGQLLVCKKKLDELSEQIVPAESFSPPYRVHAMILSLRAAEVVRDVSLIKTLGLELSKTEPQMPESYYWLWKYELKKSARKDYGDRYLSLCQNLSTKIKRKFYMEPILCSSVEEVRGASEKT